MPIIRLFLISAFILSSVLSWAQIQLLENKGQYPDQFRYVGNIPGGRVFFTDDKLTYEFRSLEHQDHSHDKDFETSLNESGSSQVMSHAYDIEFINANSEVNVVAQFPSEHLHHYFVGQKENWATGIRDFNQVEYQNLYDGIDLIYYKFKGTVKYDFKIQPNVSSDQIQLKLEGLDEYYINDNGDLNLVSSVSKVVETRPIAYQLIDERKEFIEVEFKIIGNVLSFNMMGPYDHTLPLVIDPTLIFSTYSGSTADNWGNTATFDERGNLYSGGITSHYSGGTFPTTNGAFQTTTTGFWDVAITKYDSAGTDALYSTYLGGNLSEVPQSLIVNENDELVILGVTGSSNFPTANAIQSVFQGGEEIFPFGEGDNNLLFPQGSDLFVSRLSSNGAVLESSSFIGGSGNEGLTIQGGALVRNYGDQSRGDIFVKSNGNIVFVSQSVSADFPVQNAFQPSLAGDYDAVVMELSSNMDEIVFSSFLGGTGTDAAYSVKENSEGKLVIGGGSNSNDIDALNSSFSESSLGGVDGWLAIIDASTFELDTGLYIGTNSYDQLYFLDLDADDNIYTYGQSAGSFPIVGSVFNSGQGQFVQKWQFDLKDLIASTAFGSSSSIPDISPTAFLVNDCDNIYLSGWGGGTNAGYNGGSTTNMPISSDAFQSSTSGNDFYLMTLSADLSSFLYGTYLGGSQSNTHVDGGTSRFDKRGIVYHAVCAGCGGFSDFPTTENAWSTTNNSQNCNNAAFKFDLATLRARIQTNTIAFDNPGITDICLSESIVFQNLSIGGTFYEWTFGDGGSLDTSDTTSIAYEYQNAGSYNVTLRVLDPTTCAGEDFTSIRVRVNSPVFSVQVDEIVCQDSEFILNASGANEYFWYNQDSTFQSSERSPSLIAEDSETYFVTLSDNRGCTGFDTVNIEVIPSATVDFSLSKNSDCFSRSSLTLKNLSAGSENYTWRLGDGNTSELEEFVYEYEADGVYEVTLTARNQICEYEKTEMVEINTLKVPNVFTPNGDGENDFFKIISRNEVDLKVLNRWGRVVFEQDNYQDTWEGEGEPAGVYYYEAVIETETTCKGWVQVIK